PCCADAAAQVLDLLVRELDVERPDCGCGLDSGAHDTSPVSSDPATRPYVLGPLPANADTRSSPDWQPVRVPAASRRSRRARPLSVAALCLLGALFAGSESARSSREPPRRPAAVRASGQADYPGARWVAAGAANFLRADRPFSSPITRIVIHTTESS